MRKINYLKKIRVFALLVSALILSMPSIGQFIVDSPFGWCTVDGSTNGGGNAGSVTVSSNSAFRSAVSGSSSKVVYVSGTIDLGVANWCYVGSNTTIIGLGTNARLIHGGLRLNGVSNIIIRNLAIEDARDPYWTCETPTEGGQPSNCTSSNSDYDLLKIAGGSHHVWVDHCSFRNGQTTYLAYDGSIDITEAADYITISYCTFRDNHKGMSLIGGSDSDVGNYRITYAYNWIDNNDSRNPMVRHGRVHILNNYYSNVSDYCIGLRINSRVYAERNRFYNCEDPCTQGSSSGQVQNVWNTFNSCDPNGFEGEVSSVGWTPGSYYSYSSISSTEIAGHVQSYAGSGKLDIGGGTVYQFQNRSTGQFIDGMGRTNNGDAAAQYGNTTHPNSQWRVEDAGSGYNYLINVGTGMKLDGYGRTGNGDVCAQYEGSTTHPNAQWRFVDAGSGYVFIENRGTGMRLDGYGWQVDGRDLVQYNGTTHPNAQWERISLKSAFVSDEEIDEMENRATFECLVVYPNPVDDGMVQMQVPIIEASIVDIQLFNSLGQVVYSQDLGMQQEGNFEHSINVSDLSKGIYTVSLKIGNETLFEKLMVK